MSAKKRAFNVDDPVTEVKIRLVCRDLPGARFEDPHPAAKPIREPVYVGIQKGNEVVDAVRADSRQATFEATLFVKRRGDAGPNFLGPYVHGRPTDRFLYLSWGEMMPGQKFEMFRRAKIKLAHLSWKDIQASLRKAAIVAELRLTDERGGPICATVGEKHIRWRLEK